MTRQEFAEKWGYQSGVGYGSAQFDCKASLLKDLDVLIADEVKNLALPAVITPFWLWLVREAKIDVIDAETAIEVRGFLEEGDMLVPVITFAELLELYKSQNGL